MKSEKWVLDVTKSWLEAWVLGMNLCPFAAKPWLNQSVKVRVVQGKNPDQILTEVLAECQILNDTLPTKLETTLVVLPDLEDSFLGFWDFSGLVEERMYAAGWEGILQIATFHPEYIFAGSSEEDPSNFTNRSPFPILHILREDSIGRAVDLYKNVEDIPEENIKKMRERGYSLLSAQLKSWRNHYYN